MRLRTKILLVLSVVLTLATGVSFAIQYFVVYPSFVALEQEEAVKDWQRCRLAIDREIEHLDLLCFDWSSWDDTYKYAKGEFPEYYKQNIGKTEWFAAQRLDVFYVVRPDGTVFWGQILNLETMEPAEIAWLPGDRLPPDHPLLAVKPDKDSTVKGLVMTERGLMMFASRPILTSNYEGPMAGVLIFGRLISEDFVVSLRDQTQVEFDVWDVNMPDIPEHTRHCIEEARATAAPVVDRGDEQKLKVLGVLNDMNGQSIAVINANVQPSITTRGKRAMEVASISLILASLVTLLALVTSLRIIVLKPLGALTQHTLDITTSGDMSKRVRTNRRDELGVLAGQFNKMLAKLQEFREQSMNMSRQAGMAEITTGVLHNVGNAVTNTSILAESMTEKLAQSKLPSLSKAVALINEHQAELPRYLTEDQKGRQIPGFLGHLAEYLNAEMAQTQNDLNDLRNGLRHVKEIVATQQKFAKGSTVAEPIDLHPLVSQALVLVGSSMKKHGIEVEMEAACKPTVICDRSKLQQVLVNLLTNAKDAVRDFEGATPRIVVRLGLDGQEAFVEVRDQGMGISAENITRIFNNGFTTKADGHGFGLHYSVLAAKEMGGKLTASSDGPGKGSTFRIQLPLHTQANKEIAV